MQKDPMEHLQFSLELMDIESVEMHHHGYQESDTEDDWRHRWWVGHLLDGPNREEVPLKAGDPAAL